MKNKDEKTPDAERERLADKMTVPSNRLMILVPILGIASLAALGAVVILGVTMLEELSRGSGITPEQGAILSQRIEDLHDRVGKLESRLEDTDRKVQRTTALANELYFAQPLTELEKRRTQLAGLPPSELLRQGLEAFKKEEGLPALYFQIIIDRYQDSPEMQPAMLHLGTFWVRIGNYTDAVKMLERYLDYHKIPSTLDAAKANYYLGIALSALGRNEEAVQKYHAALRDLPELDFLRATALSNLGELYLRMENKEDAVEQFEVLIRDFEQEERAKNMIKRARSVLESLQQ